MSTTEKVISGHSRLNFLPRHFPRNYLQVENAVYSFLESLCGDYRGGFWEYKEAGNGVPFMQWVSTCEKLTLTNDFFSREISVKAASIVACLYAYNACGEYDKYHLLYEHAMNVLTEEDATAVALLID